MGLIMRGRATKSVELTERDGQLLRFLWRWKLVTTAALIEKHFGNITPQTGYNRILRLRDARFIERITIDQGDRYVWTLAAKGFAFVQPNLPELKSEGYKSEALEHDFYVSAFHLGEWLKSEPEDALFSEQQLRCFLLEQYPSWVPNTDLHRSDGYWSVPLKDKMVTVSLEVELTQKNGTRYEILAKFYERDTQVFRIVWLVKTLGLANSIQEKMRQAVGDKCLIHDFVVLEDFLSRGWQAPVCLGFEKGKPVSVLFYPRGGRYPLGIMTTYLLDARKAPFTSATYPARRSAPIPDRVGLPPTPHSPSPMSLPLSTPAPTSFSITIPTTTKGASHL
jgi:hypothetical protein